MEVLLYNSNVCRLCGEENDNGTLLYSSEENIQNLSEIINTYLPIKVTDDGQLPRTICPGCSIQLEATVEFLNLIINGQKVIRELHQREKEYKKTIIPVKTEHITEKIVYEITTEDGVYHVEHPVALQVAGIDKPKRKRGRPPKKPKSPEELAQEVSESEPLPVPEPPKVKEEEVSGKRRRKTPTRFKEVVQGKELERIFKEEGVIEADDSDTEMKHDNEEQSKVVVPKEPEVIGHLETSGELVIVMKGKGRGRPKGRMRPRVSQCAICGLQFTCVGRYMSHVAQHGPVRYRCPPCDTAFDTRLRFNNHQKETGHTGQDVIPCGIKPKTENIILQPEETTDDSSEVQTIEVTSSLPDLSEASDVVVDTLQESIKQAELTGQDIEPANFVECGVSELVKQEPNKDPKEKTRIKCNLCEKTFSNRQSKSVHIKAVHMGSRSHVCGECGARFPYPRSLALHALKHRRHSHKGFACDLCGKVLNHPSSVVYHKAAEHAGQRYVCGKCGKCFKHKQLLQRHQLVHSQLRPFSCKQCDAQFKTKTNLLNHQLLHSGIKRFSCDVCNQRFAHKTSLTLHMRWHTGVKPYACATCGKRFTQKGNLSEHARIHTGEKPYSCAQCPRRFTTSSQQRLHARRHAAPAHPARSRAPRRPRPAPAPHKPHTHKQVHKQVSLLVNDKKQIPQPQQPDVEVTEDFMITEEDQPEMEERVIFLTYDDDDNESTTFHILDPEQESQSESKVVRDEMLSRCAPCAGPSLLLHQRQQDQDPLGEPALHMPVTDEHGNPLHFTMQDGTRLAITTADGESLQVITQDGETIPVEINGFIEEEVDNPDTIVHQLDINKSVDTNVTHYYTIM